MDNNDSKIWYALYVAMMLGFVVVSSVGVFMIIGFWLDRYLQTSPLMLILGSLLGFAVAFYNSLGLLEPFINMPKK